jgi:peptidoglycan/LPS O-acetylase OafA/YrhL
MKKFLAIEGLRAWLALAVLAAHLIQTTGLHRSSVGKYLWPIGTWAVIIFIIISGFVITHLIFEKQEPYPTYIARRFMRLFPAYIFSCIVGALVLPVYVTALDGSSWPQDAWYLDLMRNLVRAQAEQFWPHALAHLTMIHGALSNSVLPLAPYTFNGVTWSISLEWQFYLIAPLVIAMARDRRSLILLIAIVVAAQFAYQRGWFGEFQTASVLPAAGTYFMIGIGCRLLFPYLQGQVRAPLALSAALFLTLPLQGHYDFAALVLWGVFYLFLCADRDLKSLDRAAYRIYRACFESAPAGFLGQRSYSVYLFHFPIIALAHYALTSVYPSAGQMAALLLIGALTVPAVIVVSDFVYRVIERPGIEFGKRWSASASGVPRAR